MLSHFSRGLLNITIKNNINLESINVNENMDFIITCNYGSFKDIMLQRKINQLPIWNNLAHYMRENILISEEILKLDVNVNILQTNKKHETINKKSRSFSY